MSGCNVIGPVEREREKRNKTNESSPLPSHSHSPTTYWNEGPRSRVFEAWEIEREGLLDGVRNQVIFETSLVRYKAMTNGNAIESQKEGTEGCWRDQRRVKADQDMMRGDERSGSSHTTCVIVE